MDDRHFATWATITTAAVLMVVSVLLMVTPINLFGGWLPLPMLPLIVIFLYGLDRPASLPPHVSFGAGLLQDLLFGAAIGPWASIYLLVHAAIIWQRSYFMGRDSVVLTSGFAIACFGAAFVYWLEMSILMGRSLPLFAVLWQAVISVLMFPAALLLFRRLTGRQRSSLVA